MWFNLFNLVIAKSELKNGIVMTDLRNYSFFEVKRFSGLWYKIPNPIIRAA